MDGVIILTCSSLPLLSELVLVWAHFPEGSPISFTLSSLILEFFTTGTYNNRVFVLDLHRDMVPAVSPLSHLGFLECSAPLILLLFSGCSCHS